MTHYEPRRDPSAPRPSTWDVPGWVYLCAWAYALVSVLVLVFGLVAVAGPPGRQPVSAAEPAAGSAPAGSPSADDTYKNPTSMDQQSTDTTPLTEAQIFPAGTISSGDGTEYSLEASGSFSACSDSGGSDTAALMRAHGCGGMLTADYANDTDGTFISTMVIPLRSTDDASAVESALDADGSAAFNELMVFCPHGAAYDQTICHGSADPDWHATFTHYHRYLIIAMTVLENGGATPDDQHVRDGGGAVLDEVRSALDA